VHFDQNHGTENTIIASISVNEGTAVGARMPVNLYRTGYRFVEWNTLASGNGVEFTGQEAIYSTRTVFAIWETEPTPGGMGDFTITLNAYTNRTGVAAAYRTAVSFSVTPGQAANLWEDYTELRAALSAISGVAGVAEAPGPEFWGWFTGSTLDASGRTRRCEVGGNMFRRPAVGSANELDTILMAIVNGTAAFDGNNNIDLFAVWTLWGDVNGDDYVFISDIVLINQYMVNRDMAALGLPPLFTLPPNFNASAANVRVSGRVGGAEVERIHQYLADREERNNGRPVLFGSVLGRP